MRGTLRWARADLRAHRGQALLTMGVVAGVVAALFFAVVLLQGAVNPWQRLFDRTRALATAGKGIVFISHRLAEADEISDRVTVLRNGRNAGSWATGAK